MPDVGKAKLSKVKALLASFSGVPRKKQRWVWCIGGQEWMDFIFKVRKGTNRRVGGL